MSGDQQFIIALVIAVGTILTGMGGVYVALRQKLQEIHVQMNSRMDMLLDRTAEASHAAGVMQGQSSTSDATAHIAAAAADAAAKIAATAVTAAAKIAAAAVLAQAEKHP